MLRKFLNSRSVLKVLASNGLTVYHGTSGEVLHRILSSGLNPNMSGGSVYVTPEARTAAWYAAERASTEIPIVLEIRLTRDDVRLLKRDLLDREENILYDDYDDSRYSVDLLVRDIAELVNLPRHQIRVFDNLVDLDDFQGINVWEAVSDEYGIPIEDVKYALPAGTDYDSDFEINENGEIELDISSYAGMHQQTYPNIIPPDKIVSVWVAGVPDEFGGSRSSVSTKLLPQVVKELTQFFTRSYRSKGEVLREIEGFSYINSEKLPKILKEFMQELESAEDDPEGIQGLLYGFSEDILSNPEDIEGFEVEFTKMRPQDALKYIQNKINSGTTVSSVVSRYIESASEKKREFVRTKYKLESEDIPLLEAADPTPHGEYLDWLAKAYSRGTIRLPEDTKKITSLLTDFREFRKDPEYPGSKDINQYKTTQDLYKTIKNYKDLQKSKELSTPPPPDYAPSDAKLVVKGSNYEWYAITSVDSACAVAEGTNWCTGTPGTASSYLDDGPLYVLYVSGQPEVQVHFPTGQFMDTSDYPIADVFLYKVKCKRYCPELSRLFSAVKTRYVLVSDFNEGGWDESIIARSPKMSYEYVSKVLKGPFPAGEAAIAKSPTYAYWYAADVLKGRPFPAGEAVLAKDPEQAYYYARFVLEGPFPAGEAAIAKDPSWASAYAKAVLNGPFPAGEDAIAKDPEWAYWYARDVLEGPFPAGEAAIAKDHYWAYKYAENVLKGRFPAGEAAIATNPEWAYSYARNVLEGPFPAGEAAIAKDPQWAVNYAFGVLKGPFPAGEAAIAKDPEQAYFYAMYVLKDRFPAGEAVIVKHPQWAYEYARNVLDGPFPAGESTIAKNPRWAKAYVGFLSSKGIEIPPIFKTRS